LEAFAEPVRRHIAARTTTPKPMLLLLSFPNAFFGSIGCSPSFASFALLRFTTTLLQCQVATVNAYIGEELSYAVHEFLLYQYWRYEQMGIRGKNKRKPVSSLHSFMQRGMLFCGGNSVVHIFAPEFSLCYLNIITESLVWSMQSRKHHIWIVLDTLGPHK
jgi:hypothetical protein